jgi:hypothetical protein
MRQRTLNRGGDDNISKQGAKVNRIKGSKMKEEEKKQAVAVWHVGDGGSEETEMQSWQPLRLFLLSFPLFFLFLSFFFSAVMIVAVGLLDFFFCFPPLLRASRPFLGSPASLPPLGEA